MQIVFNNLEPSRERGRGCLCEQVASSAGPSAKQGCFSMTRRVAKFLGAIYTIFLSSWRIWTGDKVHVEDWSVSAS